MRCPSLPQTRESAHQRGREAVGRAGIVQADGAALARLDDDDVDAAQVVCLGFCGRGNFPPGGLLESQAFGGATLGAIPLVYTLTGLTGDAMSSPQLPLGWNMASLQYGVPFPL